MTEKTPNDAPYYVVSKDNDANAITVSFRKNGDGKDARRGAESGAEKSGAIIESANWISGKLPEAGRKYLARSRYRQPLEECQVAQGKSGEIIVNFSKPQETLAPGQSIVIYDGEECLGGGIIAGN